jgi:DNA-directed RNA polymerase specialized sigma24 family protein
MDNDDQPHEARVATDITESAPEPESAPPPFERFYRAELVRLIRFLRSLGANWDAAWDISQESFLKALRCWDNLVDPAKWIRTTAAREYRRAETRRADELPRMLRGGWEPRPQFDRLSLHTEETRVLATIASLPARQAEVMALTYDGYKPTEIAEILRDVYPRDNGITADAVRASLYQARHKLRRLLAGVKEV